MKFMEERHSLKNQRIQTEVEYVTQLCQVCFPWGNLGFSLQSLSPHSGRRSLWVMGWALGGAASWGAAQWNQPGWRGRVALNIRWHPWKQGKISDTPQDGSRNEHYPELSHRGEQTFSKEKWGWGRAELVGKPCAAGEAASPPWGLWPRNDRERTRNLQVLWGVWMFC